MFDKSQASTLHRLAAIAAFACGSVLSTGASAGIAIDWTAWAVGSGSTTVNGDGSITFHANSDANEVWAGGQKGNKAFYSTDDANGLTLGQLDFLRYSCVVYCGDQPSADPGGPYINIIVEDPTNSANKAQLLVLPTGVAGDAQGNVKFNLDSFRVGETSNAGWLANGTDLTFAQAKDLKIGSGTYAAMVQPTNPAGFCAASAAGCDDAVWLVWGNRGGAANYASDVTIKDVNFHVPEPGTLALLGLGLVGMAMRRRKAAA